MKKPITLDDLDRLLGNACADLDEAAGRISNAGPEEELRIKRILADALVRVWDARDIIHTSRPDLKPEYLREVEADPASYGAYLKASLEAHRLASEGKSDQAVETLKRFANATPSGYFAQVAQKEFVQYGSAI